MSQKTLYCICRSKDASGFMICCEACEDWFHGRCIKIKKKAADSIDKYYCDSCIRLNPSLRIVYKPVPEQQPEKKPIPIKQEPLEERKQEKKVFEKNVSTSAIAKSKSVAQGSQQKANQNKRRSKLKSKSEGLNRRQCANPECIYEAKQTSKYCSPDCGFTFNKLRYETHFIPKWQNLAKNNHSQAREKKIRDCHQLDTELSDVKELIKNLRLEREETEQAIAIIKITAKTERAKKLYQENENSKNQNDDEDFEMTNDDAEVASGDVLKTTCITCGGSFPGENPFKHWASCHKKHDYNFTADVQFKHTHCDEDPEPNLYCHVLDSYNVEGKKTKRYCMNFESACPQHNSWQAEKDEVCGCPLNIMQKLVPDGNYCLELKKDCNQHYHWDKFRLAQINMRRVLAFQRLDSVMDRIDKARKSLDDTYGGVVGVMLHNTLDHASKEEGFDESPHDQEEIIDMSNE